MCGIYGITASDQHFINEYMNICKHRGPDGGSKIEIVNKKSGNTVTLGHNLFQNVCRGTCGTGGALETIVSIKKNI